MDNITIAIAKGRLGEKGLELFKGTDMEIVREKNSRKLVFKDISGKTTFIFVKPSDVVTYVEKGVADLGIVGKDVILEENKDVYEIMDLDYGKCRFAIAGFKDRLSDKKNDVLRIASKYPQYVQSVFENRDQRIEIIKLNGSVELAPLIGLSDVIVDIVETGNTLRDNGLEILEDLDHISARLIVNKVSYRFKYGIIQEIERILGGE
ncbi:ATP phosphoribosyltransferase [Gudongella sp. SC589]|jgi:ATP phosphoribosyltransferase|uniref:ATP phosphoribosyltransferase n=1 Tax=Gudongella sp. SC589 TaxID=3385990 RepID=UPI00390498E9